MTTFIPGYPDDKRSGEQQRKAASNILGDVEGYAGRIVARLTGEATTIQDDNSESAMPDIRIDYADGRLAYVEVATDVDKQYANMASLLRERCGGIPRTLLAPELNRVWYLTLVGRANLARLDGKVRDLLAALEAADVVQAFHDPERMAESRNPDLAELHKLGVVQLSSRPVERSGEKIESGHIQMFPAGKDGPADVDWDAFIAWVTELVASKRFSKKCEKLLRYDADERHLFIGTSYTTPWAGFVGLLFDSPGVPETPPLLPDGITHVWVFNVQDPQRCLVWSAEDGWRDTMKHWKTE